MIMTGTTYTVTVTPDKAGTRLDRLLADAVPEMSRTRLQMLIAEGCVTLQGQGLAADPAVRVHDGQVFVLVVPAPPPATPTPQPIPLAIVYEDEALIVIDKPAGLVVHPGAGNADGTLVNALLAHCDRLSTIGAPLRPGIVHRLDKDTSGLLVAAKTDAAHLDLARQFAEHSIERAYQALVWGNPKPPAGRICNALGRNPHVRTSMAVVRRGGKAAVTCYQTMQSFGSAASLLECRLQTGRTHQIRVHMSSLGHPIVGDGTYGGRHRKHPGTTVGSALCEFPRQALHAYLIGFRHPTSHETLRFSSHLPSDFRQLLNLLEQM
jgi:23S rRNA pseudouridine1911/1915/1917 synthase